MVRWRMLASEMIHYRETVVNAIKTTITDLPHIPREIWATSGISDVTLVYD